MPKRKISYDVAVADILNFVENDGEETEDCANDDLDELYDEEQLREAAQDDSSDDDNIPEPIQVPEENNRPPRKILTKNRLVNSIDKSLDETLYDHHDFGLVHNDNDNNKKELTAYLGPKSDKNTKKIIWTNKIPQRVLDGRQRACDIIPSSPPVSSLIKPVADLESITDIFKVLFSAEMVDLIITNTNKKIKYVQRNNIPPQKKSNKYTYL